MHQDFDNETEANKFRDAKRKEGLAASRFDYGQNRFRVKVRSSESGLFSIDRMQSNLSQQAYELGIDITQLNTVKQILESDFENCTDLESMVVVAKFLLKEHWFRYPEEVISFFEGVSEGNITKFKEMVDEDLQEYEDQWNNKEN